MLRLYVPVGVTIALIVALTGWESIYSDRFHSSAVTAEEFGKRFADLPMTVGDWEGEDTPVDEKVLEVAGAVNHVSRTYRNTLTNQTVDLWLVVGHARDIGRHTPDICYPNHGMSQEGTKIPHKIEAAGQAPGEDPATFFTARFRKEMSLGASGMYQRVFWTWNANTDEENSWVAPAYQRQHFGNNPALYKMYFTGVMKERDEPLADNVAVGFAREMLPYVNHALFPEAYPAPVADATAEAKTETPSSLTDPLKDAEAAEPVAPATPAAP